MMAPRFLLCAVLCLPAWTLAAPDAAELASQQLQALDEPAPDFLLRDASGAPLQLSSLRGHVVLVHFWATWCKPCRHELPALDALVSRLNSADLVFLLISIDTDAEPAQVRQLAHELAPDVPFYLAREGGVSDRYWSWGIPATYLIDRDGRLVARALGPRDWNSPGMRTLLAGFADPGQRQQQSREATLPGKARSAWRDNPSSP
jgi:thiol-disulfide isomerase/thioredoxin